VSPGGGFRIGNAPVSWGVTRPGAPANPPWRTVLDEMSEAGYAGTELGPPGYMPAGADLLSEELSRRGLRPVGGTIMEPLHEPGLAESIEHEARRVCSILGALGAPYLVILAGDAADRAATAGRSEAALRLDAAGMQTLVDNVRRCAEVAAGYGVSAVVHPHAGTHVEFEDEVQEVLGRTEPDLVGLCLDTGHSAYAGVDPLALYRNCAERVRYLHLKDVDPRVLRRALEEGLGFEAACAAGVFCPLGSGAVDFAGLRDLLRGSGYEGWLTVEQDVEPGTKGDPRGDAVDSMEYLKGVGLVNGEGEECR
jgi:inosose dehydratase